MSRSIKSVLLVEPSRWAWYITINLTHKRAQQYAPSSGQEDKPIYNEVWHAGRAYATGAREDERL